MWPFSAHTAGPVVRLADIPSTQTATFNAVWQVRRYTVIAVKQLKHHKITTTVYRLHSVDVYPPNDKYVEQSGSSIHF